MFPQDEEKIYRVRSVTMGQGKEIKTRPDPQVEIQVLLPSVFILKAGFKILSLCFLTKGFDKQERGEIFFFYKPKVNKEEAHSVDDVQRLYIVMRPESGENPVEEKQDSLSGKEGSDKDPGDGDENSSSSGAKKEVEGGHGAEVEE